MCNSALAVVGYIQGASVGEIAHPQTRGERSLAAVFGHDGVNSSKDFCEGIFDALLPSDHQVPNRAGGLCDAWTGRLVDDIVGTDALAHGLFDVLGTSRSELGADVRRPG